MKNSTFEFVASTFLVVAFIAICVLACALAFLAGGLFTARLCGAFADGGLSGYTVGALVLESTLTVLSVRFLQRRTAAG